MRDTYRRNACRARQSRMERWRCDEKRKMTCIELFYFKNVSISGFLPQSGNKWEYLKAAGPIARARSLRMLPWSSGWPREGGSLSLSKKILVPAREHIATNLDCNLIL